jgi:hypothetical protein
MGSIREAAEKLSQKENKRGKIAEKFNKADSIEEDSTIKEAFLAKKIRSEKPKSAAGVDGGIVKKRYSSGDVIAARAVAAVFSFEETLDVTYLPSKSPEPDFEVFDADEADSLDRNAESERLKNETTAILQAMKETDRVLIDGSVVPSYLEEDTVLENYTEMFENADSGQLVGVVEDSYGKKMTSLLEEKLGIELGGLRDTLLMDAVLGEGERSFVRRYSSSPVEHPILSKLEDRHVNRLHTFYVKLSGNDLPLRIDYFGAPEEADDIAGNLLALKSSDSYTVPSPILEADKRAKVPEKYIKRLEKRFSPDLKRRDRRFL